MFGTRFEVIASEMEELNSLDTGTDGFEWIRRVPSPLNLFWGVHWQSGLLSLPLKRGDILVLSGQPRNISNIVALVFFRLKGVTVLWWGHYWSATSKTLRAQIRFFLMSLSSGIILYTDKEVEKARKNVLLRKKRITALNNGLESHQIKELRENFVLETRVKRGLFIGRLTPKASFDILIKSMTLISDPEFKIHVIGAGHFEDEIKENARRNGVFDRFIWHGALTNENLISKIANSCMFFVYPGSVGLSIIHGFMYGLPAIVHDNRTHQMPEFDSAELGFNAEFFEMGSPLSLAEKINEILDNPELLKNLSVNALKTVEDEFNIESMKNRFAIFISLFDRNYKNE
ncbi:glycosyltransferase family 4 protein [Alphaproteobacteria bacterium]|nr:glycosyltransferase family 4 protein [Alphaproteobacteria bacterium]